MFSGLGIAVGDEKLFADWWSLHWFALFTRRQLDGWWCHVVIRHLAQQVVNAVEPGAALVVGLNRKPGGFGDVGAGKHRIFGARKLLPAAPCFEVHGA